MTEKTEGAAAAAKGATRTAVKLLKEHRHAGKDHPAGATIHVTARQRTFLVEMEVIAPEGK